MRSTVRSRRARAKPTQPAASATIRTASRARPRVTRLVRLFQAARIERLEVGRLLRSSRGVSAPERHQANALERSALAPILGVGRSEVPHLGLGLHVLALQVDEELACAR